MNDIENEGGPETRSRKRRSSGGSALTDISNIGTNFLQQSFSYVGKKFGGTKKRRTSGEDLNANEGSVTIVSNNPIANLSSSSSSTIEINNSNDNGAESIHEVLNLRCDSEDCTVQALTNHKDAEFEKFGFIHRGITRNLPLQSKGSDPCECLDIYDDMYGFFVENESKFITKKYFNLQTEMSPRIRAVLVDWVIEIHFKYRMQPLTLWMIINVLDRFLARQFMPRNRLQLAAIVSLLICCKFEEVHTPEVRDCIYLTDNAYTRADVVLTEAAVLAAIEYDMMVPTPYHFLLRLFRRMRAPDRLKSICNYIAERNLHECEILDMSPRVYACASVLAGLYTLYDNLGDGEMTIRSMWTEALQEESGLTVDDILVHARQMLVVMNVPLQPSTRRKVEAAWKKYTCATNNNVAQLSFPLIPDYV